MLPNVAFAALQYHPTASIILSSSKTVLMANEAMGRLLDIDFNQPDDHDANETNGGPLYGWSLSQIGIALPREEQLIWGTWEV